MGLLCQMFQMWAQVAAGMVNLIQWLLGDEQLDTRRIESLDLVRSTFAFFLCNFFLDTFHDTEIWQLIVKRCAITFQNC